MAWNYPFTTKSDFARKFATFIGAAASDGFITTRIAPGHYGNTWQITPEGLQHLFALWGENS